MRKTTALAAGLLTVSLTLAGCGAGSDSSSSADKRAAAPQEGAAGAAKDGAAGSAAAPDSTGGAAKKAVPDATHVIRTARLEVQVKDAQRTLDTARAAAGRVGGLVENEATERVGDNHVSSTIVLRVPQDSYDAVLSELAGTGKLLSRTANAKDVTDQVVDVNSRITSQRVSVARVRELMDRATKLSDVVALEGELSNRQAALESLLSQQASLKDRTTLATITLELSEPPVKEEKEEVKKDDDPGFLDALGGGWNALVTTLRWIAVVLGALAPFLAVFGVLYVLWRIVRGRLPRRSVPEPSAWPGTVPEQPAYAQPAHEQHSGPAQPVQPQPAEPVERGRERE